MAGRGGASAPTEVNIMITSTTVSRLRWHAGLDERGADDVPSVSSCAHPMGSPTSSLQAAVADCLQTLAVLNREMNGDVPSSTVGGVEEVPRSLVYAVSEIVRMLRDCQEHAESKGQSDAAVFAKAAWRIETAWSAVLAGDIDNILKHVEGEEAGRSRGRNT